MGADLRSVVRGRSRKPGRTGPTNGPDPGEHWPLRRAGRPADAPHEGHGLDGPEERLVASAP